MCTCRERAARELGVRFDWLRGCTAVGIQAGSNSRRSRGRNRVNGLGVVLLGQETRLHIEKNA
jgi:hypothetical protein